ncbi:MAG: 30S ribosomal protein S8 [bacterium]|nr:30S ribosomal protein S8 [bacterium]
MENSIIDTIIRIKNGYMAHRDTIDTPHSGFKEEIVKKLLALKYIKSYTVSEEKIKKTMTIELLYHENVASLTDVRIFSTPGRRYYVSYKDLKPVLSGYGFSILSTPKGIMTNIEARKLKLGGELLFNIW